MAGKLGRSLLAASLLVLAFAGVSSADKCDVHEPLYRQIYQGLEPWMDGITEDHLDAAAEQLRLSLEYNPYDTTHEGYKGFAYDDLEKPINHPNFPWATHDFIKVIVINNTFYSPSGHFPVTARTNGNSFASDCSADILRQLMKSAERSPIPDTILFASSGDFTVVHGPSYNGFIPPVFSSSGGKMAYDLVLPDCYHLDMWPYTIQEYFDELQKSPSYLPYDQRQGRVIGRYNLMCPRQLVYSRHFRDQSCPRVEMHKLTLSEHNFDNLLDAGLYQFADQIDAHSSQKVNLARVSHEEQLSYKYNLILDGGTIAYRTPLIFAMNQTVLQMAGQTTTAFYTAALTPWEHFVPVARDNYTDILGTVRWLNAHPEVGGSIAGNGLRFALKHLGPEGKDCYVDKFLKTYTELQRFKVGKLSDYPLAVPLEEALDTWIENTNAVQRQRHRYI